MEASVVTTASSVVITYHVTSIRLVFELSERVNQLQIFKPQAKPEQNRKNPNGEERIGAQHKNRTKDQFTCQGHRSHPGQSIWRAARSCLLTVALSLFTTLQQGEPTGAPVPYASRQARSSLIFVMATERVEGEEVMHVRG